MFLHALESFEHGIFHYLEGEDKDRKFAFLHLDQAVELLLKEKAVRIGKSIYKKDNTTLYFHEVFKSLENAAVKVEEKPRLEEVHDLRNNIQHKGITPDERTTEFYAKIVYKFVKRFLEEELDSKLEDSLPAEYIVKMEGIKETYTKEEVSTSIGEIREVALTIPQTAIISSFVVLEKFLESQRKEDEQLFYRKIINRLMTERGLNAQDYQKDVEFIVNTRNKIVHQGDKPTDDQIRLYLLAIEKVLRVLGAPEDLDF